VRLGELGQVKNPMTSSGIKAATFRRAAQCLNQLSYRVPPIKYYVSEIKSGDKK
jgi:hypothetical protein